MALQEQHIAIKFAGGIETKMDSKSVPNARLLVLENGVFTKAISIQKRNGYEAFANYVDGSLIPVSGGRRLGKRDEELLQFTGKKCYSKQSGADQWTDMGAVFSATPRERAVVYTGTQQSMPDHATLNGVSVYAWEDSRGGVWSTVVDAETGCVYRATTQLDAVGERPRCVAVGSALHVYYANATQHTVMVLVVNPSTPSATVAPKILVSDLDATNPVYDVCATTRTGTPAAIAWHEHATTNYRIGYVTSGGILGSPASGHPSVARFAEFLDPTTPIAVAHQFVDDDNLDVLGVSALEGAAGIVKAWAISAGSASGLRAIGEDVYEAHDMHSPTGLDRIALALVDNTIWVAMETADAAPSKSLVAINHVVIAGAPGAATIQRGLALASRAFLIDGDAFAYFVHDTTYFNVYLALRLSDQACVGRQTTGGATGTPTRTHLSSVHVADSVSSVCLPRKERLKSVNNDKFGESGLRLLTLDFEDPDAFQSAQLGRGLTLAGGCPQHYDGRMWTEQNFHVGPELIATDGTAGGGSMTALGTYKYCVWYEYTDAQGEVHRGPTSVGTSVTMGAAGTQVTLTLPTLRVTKKLNVRICVGRSKNGDANQLFRVTSLDPTTSGAAANGYVANDTSVDTVTFIDRLSDVNVAKEEPLYTNGGLLSNDPAMLGGSVVTGKNRLFFTDASDGSAVRYSQQLQAGFGVECPPELVQSIDPYGGDVIALSVMDDVVIVFKREAIFAFNGDGPLPNGDTASSGFSSPQLLTSDVGCTDPASIVLVPDGLMFKSSKGIYLLDRSRSVTYAGAPAEAFNAQTVRRATVLPDRSHAVFLTDDGQSLLFDFLFKQWSTFTNHEGYDSVVVDGRYHYLRTDGRVFRETPGEYTDAGVRITLRFETAWIHMMEHLQGLQRFWNLVLLGTYVSPHQLGVQFRTDFESAWCDPMWLDATGDTDSDGWITGDNANIIGEDPITGSAYGDGAYGEGPYGGTDPTVYQWRVGLHEQGQSIQFRFEDFEKVGLAGASFELTEMVVTGGVMKPTTRPFTGARST